MRRLKDYPDNTKCLKYVVRHIKTSKRHFTNIFAKSILKTIFKRI